VTTGANDDDGSARLATAVSPAAGAVLDVLNWTEVTQVIIEVSVR
jgi:hypothetical protein